MTLISYSYAPKLELDLSGNGPRANPQTFTDITSVWLSATAKRGRSFELDEINDGRASIVVDNSDRRFDPTWPGTVFNYFENPSFETNINGVSLTSPSPGGKTSFDSIARDLTTASQGSACLKCTSSSTADRAVWFYKADGTRMAYTAGTKITVSFDAKAVNANTFVGMLVQYYDSGGTKVQEIDIGNLFSLSTSAWTRVSATHGTVGSGAVTMIVGIYAQGATNGTIFVDGLLVEQKASASAYADPHINPLANWIGTADASQTYYGSYYTRLKPMISVRISVDLTTNTEDAFHNPSSITTNYPLWTGHILDPMPHDQLPGYSEVEFTAVDNVGVLSLSNVSGTWAQEGTGTRIARILALLGMPSARYSVDTGVSLAAAVTIAAADKLNALSHIQSCERTERGRYYTNGSGQAIFDDRNSITPGSSSATFGDTASTDLVYESVSEDYGEQRIYNDVNVTDSGGTTSNANDSTSQNAYWPRTLSWDTVLPSGSADAATHASALLAAYKDPHWRFTSLTFMASLVADGGGSVPGELANAAATLDIGSRITVKKTPPPQTSTAKSVDSLILSVEHVFERGADSRWLTTYELVPV